MQYIRARIDLKPTTMIGADVIQIRLQSIFIEIRILKLIEPNTGNLTGSLGIG